jgi:hypothetical protein
MRTACRLHKHRGMKTSSQIALSRTLAAGALVATIALPSVALADGEAPYRFENRADYGLEVEPHFAFGAENVYGATGFGAGLRVSIPLVYGHIGRLPDNLAFSFGGDVLHYDNCYYATNCGANYVMLPAAAQWNVYVARRVSLFLEGGVFVYKGWFDRCDALDGAGCNAPSDFGLLPTVAIGGRIHMGDNVSFIARVGYPTTTFGLSFL